jgi:hypothetical protein
MPYSFPLFRRRIKNLGEIFICAYDQNVLVWLSILTIVLWNASSICSWWWYSSSCSHCHSTSLQYIVWYTIMSYHFAISYPSPISWWVLRSGSLSRSYELSSGITTVSDIGRSSTSIESTTSTRSEKSESKTTKKNSFRSSFLKSKTGLVISRQ